MHFYSLFAAVYKGYASVSVRIPIWYPKKVHKILLRRQSRRQRRRRHKHAHVLCTGCGAFAKGVEGVWEPFTCAASIPMCMCGPCKKEKKSERQNTKTNAQERETDIRKTLRIGVGERAELPSLRSERARALVTEPVRAAATGRRTMWMVQWKWDAYGPLNRSETWTVRRSQDLNLRKSFSYERNIWEISIFSPSATSFSIYPS